MLGIIKEVFLEEAAFEPGLEAHQAKELQSGKGVHLVSRGLDVRESDGSLELCP